MEQLRSLAAELRSNGISLVVDFIFNHTSDEHEWARKAAAGDPEFSDYYWIFPDRTMPDAFEQNVREIFPDDHPGSFIRMEDGRWVWATFHTYQWDLNYSQPRRVPGHGRARCCSWPTRAWTSCGWMPWRSSGSSWAPPARTFREAHTLLQAFNAVCRLAAPSLLFKSEAIVHPDEVALYINPGECQLSYNPLQMALIWESLATRDVSLLAQALERRHNIPDGTAWVNYVRSHDDIGWTFADEDAAELGINGFDHRRFLNSFYVNRFPGSFARGVPFQDNPRTGDCRISGTTASLVRPGGRPGGGRGTDPAGPLGRLQHRRHPAAVPGRRGGAGQRLRLRRRTRPRRRTAAGCTARTIRRRSTNYAHTATSHPARCGVCRAAPDDRGPGRHPGTGGHPADRLRHAQPPECLAYQRPGASPESTRVLALANFSDSAQDPAGGNLRRVRPCRRRPSLRSCDAAWTDGLTLLPRQFVWLRVTPL